MKRRLLRHTIKHTCAFYRRKLMQGSALLVFIGFIKLSCREVSARDLTTEWSPAGPVLHQIDNKGKLLNWIELQEYEVTDKVRIPLRIAYTTDRQRTASGLVGSFWWLPIFSSHVMLISESRATARLPWGQELKLYNRTGEQFKTLNGEWTGRQEGDKFVLASRDGSEVYEFSKGELKKLSINTAGGDPTIVLKWQKSSDVESITSNGKILVQAFKNPDGKLIKLKAASGFELAAKYQMDLTANGSPTQEVDNFTYGNGMAVNIHKSPYDALTPEREVTISKEFRGVEAKKDVVKFDQATGLVKSVNDWRYTIDRTPAILDLKAVRNNGASISFHNDMKRQVRTITDENGRITVMHAIGTPGPNYGQVRKISIDNNGVNSTLIKNYDAQGRLISESDGEKIIRNKVISENHGASKPSPAALQKLGDQVFQLLSSTKKQ